MTEEQKQTEVASTTTVDATIQAAQPPAERTIVVDIYGESCELPLSKAKAIIAKRDSKTKEYNELKNKIDIAESQAKAEAERASLLESMRKQDIDAVEEQVAAKYIEKINRFESKVFNSDIKTNLSKLGIVSEAIDDAVKLVLTDAKATLENDEVKLNGIKIDEYLKTWVEKKPHLLAAKTPQGTGANYGTGAKIVPKDSGFAKFAQTVFKSK